MIYLDTSVVLAHLLAEDRVPPPEIWSEDLASSRLLEYELWNRIHDKGLSASHGEAAHAILAQIAMVEMSVPVLSRAIDKFPAPVRTLDALHLASVEFLRKQTIDVRLASYDLRMITAAKKMKIPIYRL